MEAGILPGTDRWGNQASSHLLTTLTTWRKAAHSGSLCRRNAASRSEIRLMEYASWSGGRLENELHT